MLGPTPWASDITWRILIDKIPISGCNLLISNLGHTVHRINLVLAFMDICQVNIHIIEYFLCWHAETREWLLGLNDLTALTHQEFSEYDELLAVKLYVSENYRRRRIRQACNFKLFHYFRLHTCARQTIRIKWHRTSTLGQTILNLLIFLRNHSSGIEECLFSHSFILDSR